RRESWLDCPDQMGERDTRQRQFSCLMSRASCLVSLRCGRPLLALRAGAHNERVEARALSSLRRAIMPIPFACPKCQTAYKVKDDMAGKRVTCRACKAVIRVPEPPATAGGHLHEAEALAIEALADEPVRSEVETADLIEMECPQCMEQVKLEGKFAGKQAPCPSCRRIIRV